jgi:hypothetical protein
MDCWARALGGVTRRYDKGLDEMVPSHHANDKFEQYQNRTVQIGSLITNTGSSTLNDFGVQILARYLDSREISLPQMQMPLAQKAGDRTILSRETTEIGKFFLPRIRVSGAVALLGISRIYPAANMHPQ